MQNPDVHFLAISVVCPTSDIGKSINRIQFSIIPLHRKCLIDMRETFAV